MEYGIALFAFACTIIGGLLGFLLHRLSYNLGYRHGQEDGIEKGRNAMFFTLMRVKKGAKS